MEKPTLEKNIEKGVCIFAKHKNILTYKFKSTVRSVPDRIFITPKGKVIFIEFKRQNISPTKMQALTIQKFLDYNCNVHVVDNTEQGIEILQSYLDEEQE